MDPRTDPPAPDGRPGSTYPAPHPPPIPNGPPPAHGMVPASPGPPPQTDPILLWIGDIGVSQHWVMTPNGTGPLARSQWIVRDSSRMEERMPAYAIVLAVIFFLFCLIGLLFLLIKERRMVGYVEVTVRTGSIYHVAQLPARHPAEVDDIRRLVHQAQSMAYALG